MTKLPKMPKVVTKITTNIYVLYFVTFLALTNILGYAIMGKNVCVVLFLLLGLVSSYFTDNMTIVLLIPTIFVGFFAICDVTMNGGMKEGARGMKKAKKMFKKAGKRASASARRAKKKVNKAARRLRQRRRGFTTMDEPEASEDTESGSSDVDNMQGMARKPATRIDYSTTLEDAYENLNSILDGKGLQGLTNDTQNLMQQQMKLAEAMKGMKPLMDSARGMMKTLKMDGLIGSGK